MDYTTKNDAVEIPVYITIANALIHQIRFGKLHPKCRIPSERELAQQWRVSRGTARLAVKHLENLGYIERRGAKGSFLRREYGKNKPRNIVFAFPEKSISQDILPFENWAYSSELFRGLLADNTVNNIRTSLEHFQDNVSLQEFNEQLKRLHNYDAAVFVGPQLSELQTAFAANHPVIQVVEINAFKKLPEVIPAGFDVNTSFRLLVDHALECGVKTVGAFTFDKEPNVEASRAKRFLQYAADCGFDTPECFDYHIPDVSNIKARFDEILAEALPDFIFCNHAEYIIDFYEAAARNKVKIGRDVKIAGIATGLTFKGLIPSYTYVRIPMFELGRTIVNALAEDFSLSSVPIVEPVLIKGNSTVSKASDKVDTLYKNYVEASELQPMIK